MRWVMVFALLVFIMPPDAAAEDDAAKAFLTGVGRSFAAGNAGTIAKYFPAEGKVDLRLSGIKEGSYREAQAKSLLATWFKGIKPKECKLTSVKGLVGRFSLTYQVVADGTTVTKTIQVSLRREGEEFLIVGILES
jgi:hypothetical protein